MKGRVAVVYGQVYVAFSRIITLNGLWDRGGCITQSFAKAHPKVKAFYQQDRTVSPVAIAVAAAPANDNVYAMFAIDD